MKCCDEYVEIVGVWLSTGVVGDERGILVAESDPVDDERRDESVDVADDPAVVTKEEGASDE